MDRRIAVDGRVTEFMNSDQGVDHRDDQQASVPAKAQDAYRTISEAAELLDLPQHVLRFWEGKFTQIKPLKRSGNRRYYRPADVETLLAIKKLLHDNGYTIRGVQKLFKEQGLRSTVAMALGVTEDPKPARTASTVTASSIAESGDAASGDLVPGAGVTAHPSGALPDQGLSGAAGVHAAPSISRQAHADSHAAYAPSSPAYTPQPLDVDGDAAALPRTEKPLSRDSLKEILISLKAARAQLG